MPKVKIGTVEILRQRVYHDGTSEVIVEPGTFDLYRDGTETFWIMRARKKRPNWENLGGGTLLHREGDEPTGRTFTFRSKRFSPDEWADLLSEPNFTEGHAEQRLRVTLTTPETGK